MKKFFYATLSLICLITMLFLVTACVNEETVTVTMPTNPVGYTVSGEATAVKGQSYQFTVTISDGFVKGDNFRVAVNDATITEKDGKYVVENVTEDLVIAVEGVVQKTPVSETVTVTFPTDPVGYTVSGDATAVKGGNYQFTVEIANTYEAASDFAVTVNGQPVNGTNGKYVVENVTENLVIAVTGVNKRPDCLTVTLPAGKEYTVIGEATVLKGSDYEFTLTIADEYEKGADFAVSVNDTPITETNGKYVVENVQGDLTIKVVGVTAKPVYNVTWENNQSWTITGAATALKGSNYEFTLTIANAYETDATFAVSVNGTPITAVEGKYTVENVTGDLTITVVGVVAKPSYSVTLPADTVGYTVTGETTVTKGGSYTFTVAIAQYYKQGNGFAVKVNGTPVNGTDNTYTIDKVTEDITITVEGVERVVCSVNPETGLGYNIVGNNSVEQGTSYTFRIEIEHAYKQGDNFAVKVNGNTVTAVEGVYTVETVTEDLTISVEGVVAKNVYNVTLPEGQDGFTVTGDATVLEGDNYIFTVTISAGYEKNDFVVTANGKPVSEVDGKYVIENVTGHTVIAVDGVEESALKATFSAEGFNDALKNSVVEFSYHASKFTFKINLTTHYTQCADRIAVYYRTAGSEEILVTPNSDGVYVIDNPHKNVYIIVKNVSLNTYTVTFYRNTVEKHSVQVTAKAALTEAQLNAAKNAILGEGETFGAWIDDVTAQILEDTSIHAYVAPSFGETVGTCPVVNGTQLTLGEGEYSAAGFEKIYKVTGATTNIFADINLRKASEVRFAFKLGDKTHLLFKGYWDYIDEQDVWYDVVMTNDGVGNWTVRVTGPVHHAEEGVESHMVSGFTAQYSGVSLANIFSSWYTDDTENGVTIYITELRKTEFAPYGEVIGDVPADGFTATTQKDAPVDFENAYYLKNPESAKFADVDISKYGEVKFYFGLPKGYFAINGWGAYAEASGVGVDTWVPVTLKNNGDGTWTITVSAKLTGGNVTSESSYEYTCPGSKLSELLKSWFSFADTDDGVYLTEIRGVKAEFAPFGQEIEGGVLKSGTTEDTTEETPIGFEKVYKVNGTFDQDKKNDADLSEYTTIKFALKSDEYFLMSGWSIYLKESQTDWVFVTMVNNGNGTWEVKVVGDVCAGGVENPWTHTYTGNSIATILADWYNGSNIYVTELRGVKAE